MRFHSLPYVLHKPPTFLQLTRLTIFALITNYEPVRRHVPFFYCYFEIQELSPAHYSQTPQSMISSLRETVSSKSLQDK